MSGGGILPSAWRQLGHELAGRFRVLSAPEIEHVVERQLLRLTVGQGADPREGGFRVLRGEGAGDVQGRMRLQGSRRQLADKLACGLRVAGRQYCQAPAQGAIKGIAAEELLGQVDGALGILRRETHKRGLHRRGPVLRVGQVARPVDRGFQVTVGRACSQRADGVVATFARWDQVQITPGAFQVAAGHLIEERAVNDLVFAAPYHVARESEGAFRIGFAQTLKDKQQPLCVG